MFIIVYPIFFYSYFSSFSLFTAQKDNILKSSLKYSILYKPSLNLYLNLKEFTPSNQNVNTINNFNNLFCYLYKKFLHQSNMNCFIINKYQKIININVKTNISNIFLKNISTR